MKKRTFIAFISSIAIFLTVSSVHADTITDLTVTGTATLGGGAFTFLPTGLLGVGTTTPSNALTLEYPHRLKIYSNGIDDNGEVLILQNKSDNTKATIAWKDMNGKTKAWATMHDFTSNRQSEHKHFSIEISDVSGKLQTRLGFPYDCDYNCDMHVNQSNLLISRSSGQSNGNLFLDGGNVKSSGNFDMYPNRFSNNTVAFRTSLSSLGNIQLQTLGSSYIEFADNLIIQNGLSLGIGTNVPQARLEINGGMRLNTQTLPPACNVMQRGTFWFIQGTTTVKDTVMVCAKDAADVYGWRILY